MLTRQYAKCTVVQHIIYSGGSSAQSLEWQPQPTTKLNSAVLIACIVDTWEFWIIVGEMIQRTVDISCRRSNPDKITRQTKTTHDEWPRGRQTREVRFQLRGIGKGGACCGTVKISPVKELVRLSLATMILLSDRKSVKIAGKGNEFSTNQLWDRTSGSDFWTN